MSNRVSRATIPGYTVLKYDTLLAALVAPNRSKDKGMIHMIHKEDRIWQSYRSRC